jgi:hypothetical protein
MGRVEGTVFRDARGLTEPSGQPRLADPTPRRAERVLSFLSRHYWRTLAYQAAATMGLAVAAYLAGTWHLENVYWTLHYTTITLFWAWFGLAAWGLVRLEHRLARRGLEREVRASRASRGSQVPPAVDAALERSGGQRDIWGRTLRAGAAVAAVAGLSAFVLLDLDTDEGLRLSTLGIGTAGILVAIHLFLVGQRRLRQAALFQAWAREDLDRAEVSGPRSAATPTTPTFHRYGAMRDAFQGRA